MTKRHLVLLSIPLCVPAILLSGCRVRVTEPLSDPNKAEPDKRLIGKWTGDDDPDVEINAPAVKGNPKGLMRAINKGRVDDPGNAFWFFTSSVGKHTYATIYVNSDDEFADFRKEGAFEKWNKGNRRYCIFQFVLDGDNVTVDCGSSEAMKNLMKNKNFDGVKDTKIGPFGPYFKTPPGWFAAYLEKSGPQTLYDGIHDKYQRRSIGGRRSRTCTPCKSSYG